MYLVELGGDGVLQHGRMGLSLDLAFHLPVDKLVALGQRHPFQRVGGDYLRAAFHPRAGEDGKQEQYVNGSRFHRFLSFDG